MFSNKGRKVEGEESGKGGKWKGGKWKGRKVEGGKVERRKVEGRKVEHAGYISPVSFKNVLYAFFVKMELLKPAGEEGR